MLSINQNKEYSDMSFLHLCDLIDEKKQEIEDLKIYILELETSIKDLENNN